MIKRNNTYYKTKLLIISLYNNKSVRNLSHKCCVYSLRFKKTLAILYQS